MELTFVTMILTTAVVLLTSSPMKYGELSLRFRLRQW